MRSQIVGCAFDCLNFLTLVGDLIQLLSLTRFVISPIFPPFPHEYSLSALFPVPVTAFCRQSSQSINGCILGFCRHHHSMVDAF